MNPRLHIGLVSHAWPVNEFPSGIITYVHVLRAQLMQHGHRVSVFVKKIGNTNTDSGIYLVKPTVPYRIRRKLAQFVTERSYDVFNWGQAISATVNRVSREDPIDVLEMEESFGWCADVQQRVSCPVVVKLHGPAFLTLVEEDRQTEMAAAKIEMEGRALQQIGSIISPSQNALSNTVARYGLRPRLMKIIPNLLEAEPGLKLWNLDECDRKAILFVGRFDKLKGGDSVLFAFRKLLETDDSLKLIFVGPNLGLTASGRSPILFDEFRSSLFPEALRGSVQYLGQLPRNQIADLRTRALMSIVASRWENQGYTALEAMLQGCPVVTTDVGGMKEIIQHGVTGLLARANDIDDLCRKMTSLLKDPLKARQLGENARRFVMDQLSPERLAAETVDVYHEVIAMAKAVKN